MSDLIVLALDDREPHFPQGLTPTEVKVARLVFQGLTNAEIASERTVSVRTVGKQVSSLLRKTGTSSRAELVVLLLQDSSSSD